MRPAIISALSAVGFAVGGWAVQVAFPHVDPLVGKAMLAASATLILLAFGLWLWGVFKVRHGGDGGQTIVGHGNNQAGRDINIHADPVEVARQLRLQSMKETLERERVLNEIVDRVKREASRARMDRIARGEE